MTEILLSSIEKLAESLVEKACLHRVSDIHLIPRELDALIQLRLDQELFQHAILKRDIFQRLLAHFKFLGGMDIGEKRKPQSGSLMMQIENQRVYLRLSTLPTVFDESLVIRVLPQDNMTSIHFLSLFPHSTRKLLALLQHSHGLLIFTGPTGSGKTTTLYTLLQQAKSLINRNIITLEDPVEKQYDGVLQVQVNERAGITYEKGLRAILRHDPDIIMVGEIRDDETAKIAVRAALTGHLVLTTMHTRDTKGAIYRLLEFGVPYQEIYQTLIGVVAQRLVQIRCPYCKEKCVPLCKIMRKQRQAGIYEFLYGKVLKEVLQEANGKQKVYSYPKLKDMVWRGVAFGYLYPSVLESWKAYD